MALKVKFLKSAVVPKDYPHGKKPEVGVIGRSNAGKSSFINALVEGRNQKVAKVSSTPGKTRLLNFFQAGDHYLYVDMPGYGFASRSYGERDDWKPMVEQYLKNRENLVAIVLIMDIRRDWEQEEQLMWEWAQFHEIPLVVVLNKMDKVKRNFQLRRARQLAEKSGVNSVFMISALKKQGIDELEDYLFRNFVKDTPRKEPQDSADSE
ncbi:MAG: YihA family ribosome biogenesis GTP-binding protein [Bdellovibrionales bacterium]|nr:YihA family ribosome biogenesis GTP-binding protein [Bdellovibrionales bacterium]